MKCAVCGQEYGVAHQCAGIAAAPDVSDVPAPPQGFALGHYLQEAFRIATWNDAAIRRTMNDQNAILYGVIVYAVAVSLLLLNPILRFLAAGRFEHATIVASSLALVLIAAAFFDFLKVGICHFLSKWFSAGSGKFTQLLGPLMLGSVVYALYPIPFVGPLAAGIAWIAVFAMVFQEVHGVEPLTAFLYSAGVNVTFLIIQLFALPARH
ncbi:MAG: hypothetical protein NVS9B14_04550 [Candidatus Acidiferrum sp.]